MQLYVLQSGLFQYCLVALVIVIVAILLRIVYLFTKNFDHLKNSCIYYGRVTHTRLKGGAIHHIDYPIFLTYLDLKEVETIGWSLWPIFKLNSPSFTFASFDNHQHLKDYQSSIPHSSSKNNMFEQVEQFVQSKSVKDKADNHFDRICILTHLTYFGYCFNPISVYYLFKQTITKTKTIECLDTVIAEVSNTPWIEMHSYVLQEDIPGIRQIIRIPPPSDSANTSASPSSSSSPLSEECIRAIWKKDFHVSPFMEMDYHYDFQFYTPTKQGIKLYSKMLKDHTNEVWFTANFELQQLSFTPQNLLYVLIFYPLQTRFIQLYIHIEAVKLFWKGVPTFEHPNGTDVDFGYGITGKRLGNVIWGIIQPFYWLTSLLSSVVQTSSSSPSISSAGILNEKVKSL